MEATKWYEEKKGKVHGLLVPLVKFLRQNQAYRHAENLRNVRLYGNLDIMGINALQYNRPTPAAGQNRVTLNVIKSCIDTAQSKIAKNKVKPTFLTDGGNWHQQRKAKKLDKFILGQFYSTDVYTKAQKSFVDACIFGGGFLKIYPENGKICVERTIPDELITDDGESIYGSPRNKYQTKFVHKDALILAFPKFKNQIEALESIRSNTAIGGPNYHADIVIVYEGWHLPTKRDSSDGRHVISIEGADLVDEQWKKETFPFSKFNWSDKPFGYWGGTICEEIMGIQVEINKILKNIQIAHHLLSAPAVYVEEGSKVSSQHLNNEIGRIIKYKGVMPTVKADGMIHPEIYSHLENLYRKAFEIVGISQLSAQSQKPAGLNSGKALREYNDIESERFLIVGQKWESFFMDIAKQMISCAKEIYEEDKDFSVKVKGKKFIEEIKWSEVDLEEDQYVMQVFPTSMLPHSPEGRLEAVQEMLQAWMIDPDTGAELLDYPDLERANDLRYSSRQVIREIVDKIVEEGVFTAPEPYMNLQYAVEYAQMSYNRAKIENAPEEHLELLRRFMEQAIGFMETIQTPEQAPPMPEQMPQAMPEQIPQAMPEGMPMDIGIMPQEGGY
jgi:hypothetical protein